MRSVFLEGIASEELACEGLSVELPGQTASTRVVFDPTGKHAVGYVYIGEVFDTDDQLGPFLIQADYSGKQLGFDAKSLVVDTLVRIQSRIGGEFRDYGD